MNSGVSGQCSHAIPLYYYVLFVRYDLFLHWSVIQKVALGMKQPTQCYLVSLKDSVYFEQKTNTVKLI